MMVAALVMLGVVILVLLAVWDLGRPWRASSEARRLDSLGDVPQHKEARPEKEDRDG